MERRGIPTRSHPIQAFYFDRGAALYHDPETRAEYDAATLAIIGPFLPDLLLLDGYRYLITAPLLRAFPARIINLHFSDLTLRRADGRPRFPGLRAVRDALAAGCADTRATVHLVNEEPDEGPPIVRSWPFPVSPLVDDLRTQNAADMFKVYAFTHQQWMMRTAAGPLMAAALRLIASGAVDLDELAACESSAATTWMLDQGGILLAPDAAMAGV